MNRRAIMFLLSATFIVVGVGGLFWTWRPGSRQMAAGTNVDATALTANAGNVPAVDPSYKNSDSMDGATNSAANGYAEQQHQAEQSERLLSGLLSACDALDIGATEELRSQLLTHDKHTVSRLASALLPVERTGQSARTLRQRSMRIANLQFFVAPVDPSGAMAEVRRLWSNPEMSNNGSLDRWKSLSNSHVSSPAAMANDDVEKMEASAVGDALAHGLAGHASPAVDLLRWLKAYCAGFTSGDELPDPWLSVLLYAVGGCRTECHPDQWNEVLPWLKTVAGNKQFSERLRYQAELLLVGKPADFWGLLETMRQASRAEVASEAFWQFLVGNSMSNEEVRMFLATFAERFGAVPGAYQRFMWDATRNGAGAVPATRWSEFACRLFEVAETSEDPAEFRLALSLIHPLSESWRGILVKSAKGPLLNNVGTGALARLQVMHRRSISPANLKGERWPDFPPGHVLMLVWFVDAPVDDVLQAAAEMITRREAIGGTEFHAITQGLLSKAPEMSTGQGLAVANLLSDALVKYDFTKHGMSPVENRPVTPMGLEPGWVLTFDAILRACSYPPLVDAARKMIVATSEVVATDAPHWQGKTWRVVSVSQVAKIELAARQLAAAYGNQ